MDKRVYSRTDFYFVCFTGKMLHQTAENNVKFDKHTEAANRQERAFSGLGGDQTRA